MKSVFQFWFLIGVLTSAEINVLPREASDIRRVDFSNFTFQSFLKKVKLRDGWYKEGDEGFWQRYHLNEVKFADFDNDGKEEALVVVDFETSGTMDNAKDYFVFRYTRGKPMMIFHQWRQRPRSLEVRGRRIIIAGPFWNGAPLCCPNGLETSVYRWSKNRFVRASRRREYKDPYTNWWLSRRVEQALEADAVEC